MKFDVKKILKEFYKQYDYVHRVIYDEDSEVAGMRDAVSLYDMLFDNEEFLELVRAISKERGDFFDSSVEISSLMFALDEMGILDYFD